MRNPAWPFGELNPLSFDFIMADPPWPFRVYSETGETKSPQAHYDTMPVEEICALPVGQLAAGDCVLMMWFPWPLMLEGSNQQDYREVGDPSRSPIGRAIKSWGFRFCTAGVWHKKTKNGKTSFGTGYRLRSACEPFVIALTGNPVTTNSSRNLIEGLAREHSRKPEESYRWAEKLMPRARRLNLFSREQRKGWSAWGNEVDKFDGNEAKPAPRRPKIFSAADDGQIDWGNWAGVSLASEKPKEQEAA